MAEAISFPITLTSVITSLVSPLILLAYSSITYCNVASFSCPPSPLLVTYHFSWVVAFFPHGLHQFHLWLSFCSNSLVLYAVVAMLRSEMPHPLCIGCLAPLPSAFVHSVLVYLFAPSLLILFVLVCLLHSQVAHLFYMGGPPLILAMLVLSMLITLFGATLGHFCAIRKSCP